MKRLVISFGIIIFFGFLVHSAYIIHDGLKDELNIVDVGIVLGNKVELSGVPSMRLKARLDRTVELYRKNYFDHIIVSGGIGKEGYDEAVVMKDYLVTKGIPGDIIILDHEGYNTFLTAQNSKEIMLHNNFDTAMVISQYFHITRTKLAFKKLGLSVYSAHARIFEIRDIYSYAREFAGFYKYLLFY